MGRALISVIPRLLWNVPLYWTRREVNKRQFSGQKRTKQELVGFMKETVRFGLTDVRIDMNNIFKLNDLNKVMH